MVKVGVTGTRSGMNKRQKQEFTELLTELGTGEFHHGDCVGVDVEAAKIAEKLGWRTVCHPPVKDELRAYHKSDEIREPKSYFARNRNIVDETDVLLVVPYQDSHQSQGGTWYTNDYAVKKSKPRHIIFPKNN
jgi:hypothetical protein